MMLKARKTMKNRNLALQLEVEMQVTNQILLKQKDRSQNIKRMLEEIKRSKQI